MFTIFRNILKVARLDVQLFYIFAIIPIFTVILSLAYGQVRGILEKNLFRKHNLIERRIRTSIERYLICDNIDMFTEFLVDDLKAITKCEKLYIYLYDRLRPIYNWR